MDRRIVLPSVFSVLLLAGTSDALATVHSSTLGINAPTGSLGGYGVIPFASDVRALGDEVSSVPVPPGATPAGEVGFDTPLTHARAGTDWATWSHGYAGDVYWLDELGYGVDAITLTLPADTKAFYFYMEPDEFSTLEFSVTSGDQALLLNVEGGGGAQGVGFYVTDPGEALMSVTIRDLNNHVGGFAVGEFGINGIASVPDSSVRPLFTAGIAFGFILLSRRGRRATL